MLCVYLSFDRKQRRRSCLLPHRSAVLDMFSFLGVGASDGQGLAIGKSMFSFLNVECIHRLARKFAVKRIEDNDEVTGFAGQSSKEEPTGELLFKFEMLRHESG